MRLATRSAKLVGNAAELLAVATLFQVYLFPVFKHLTETPLIVDVALICLHAEPIFVAACAPAGTTRVANDNVRQAKPDIRIRFMSRV